MLLIGSAVSCCAAGVEDPVTRKAAKFGSVEVSGTDSAARQVRGSSHGKRVSLSAWGLDGALDYVHGMYYMAVLIFVGMACGALTGVCASSVMKHLKAIK